MDKEKSIREVSAALEQLAQGGMVIVVDDFTRENEGDLIAAAEFAGPEVINFMAKYGRGLICQPITRERADTLGLSLMVEGGGDSHGTAFTPSVDAKTCSTGISAFERADTVQVLIDETATPEDLVRPGHLFPLIAQEGGVFARKGHTEAAVDLTRLAGLYPSGVICEIMNDDGTMARLPELKEFSQAHALPIVSVEQIIAYRDALGDVTITEHSSSRIPTPYGEFRITTYESEDPAVRELITLESETPAQEIPFVRIHSECLTGEGFASLRCDCGPQLERALELVGSEGGMVIYLKQEGRGIGLHEKIKAYALQDEGMDTYEANIALGHEADGRRYGAAVALLKQKGYDSVRLLTNNPDKVEMVKLGGIPIVEQVSHVVGHQRKNRRYLETKVEKFGHMMEVV